MTRAKLHLEYIPLVLEQISENQDRIGRLVSDAENGLPVDSVKEIERITTRNKSLLHLVANMIEEIKKCPPDMVPPISPVRFY